ncbi:MAG: sensor histidine kinase, partial [Acidimicrobiales bacterium]
VRRARLAAVGEMATVIGHELRNPLAAVTNAHFLLRRSIEDREKAERHLALAERETARAANLAEDLTAYMREREPVLESVAVGEILVEILEATPAPSGVTVDVEVPHLNVLADRDQLTRMLTNLVDNAFQAMPGGGSARVSGTTENGSVLIRVHDSGTGLDPENLARLFEPFFTTKADGTGLGLAIVRRLAEAHGGEVSIENGPTQGAVATLRFPPAADSSSGERSQ